MTSSAPLTHHEIVRLIEPLARRGLRPDLAGSDRAERRVRLQPIERAGTGVGPFVEHLELQVLADDRLRLVRTLELSGTGLKAALQADGPELAALADTVAAVAAEQQLFVVAGCPVALSHRVAPTGSVDAPALVLREAEALLPGLRLRTTVSSVAGYPAEIELVRAPRATSPAAPFADPAAGDDPIVMLPPDLFSVLGSGWDRLVETSRGWRGSVKLRGAEPRRTAAAQLRLVEAVEHLQRTLAGTPASFHARHRAARWRVALGEAVPVLVGVGIVAAAIGIQRWWPERASWLAMLANIAPPLLMALFFMRREMPRIGLPRFPRRLPPTAWRAAPSVASGPGAGLPAAAPAPRVAPRAPVEPA
jgi:hypothetical protein